MKKERHFEQVPDVLEKAALFLEKHSVSARDAAHFRLLMEEIILLYRENRGCTAFTVEMRRRSGKAHVLLGFGCEAYDALSDEEDVILRNLLKATACDCEYTYKKGINFIRLSFETARTLANNLRFITHYIRAERSRFTLSCIMGAISIPLSIVLPILTADLISSFALGAVESAVITAAALFGISMLNNVVMFLANALQNRAYDKIMNSIEKEITDSVLDMEVETLDKHGSGMIIQRMTGDTITIARSADGLMMELVKFIRFVGTLVAIAVLSPMLFAAKLAGLSIVIAVTLKATDVRHDNDRSYRLMTDRFTGFAGEMVRGSKDIKLLNSEKVFSSRFDAVIKETNRLRLNLLQTTQKYTLLSNALTDTFNLAYHLLLLLLLGNGTLLPTHAVVLFNYSNNLTDMPDYIEMVVNYIKRLSLSGERLYHLVNSRDFKREKFGTRHSESFRGEVEFRNLTFAYNSDQPLSKRKNVLNGLSLTIHEGEMVAFVGRSGCGKTTALNLIAGLYKPTSGELLLDGTDIRELDKETIRSHITAVSQMPYMFNMSVRDNLSIVRDDVTEEELIAACKDACIHEDILRMPNGYDTIIGEGGVMLSGGQRQRLALARSMLKNYRILLLDEATSALDNNTQTRVQEVIDRFRGKRTMILVAHRLSTIRNCDRIFFFENGKVLAEGSHERLLETCPEYRALYLNE